MKMLIQIFRQPVCFIAFLALTASACSPAVDSNSRLRLRPGPDQDNALVDSPVFYRGINLGGSGNVTIEGNAWLSHSQALSQGMSLSNTTVWSGTYGFSYSPAAPGDIGLMLQSQVYRPTSSNGLGFTISQTVPSGAYEIYVWTLENNISHFRDMNVDLQGVRVANGIGDLNLGEWRKYGPYSAQTSNGVIQIQVSRATKGDPTLAGIAFYSVPEWTPTPTATPTPTPGGGCPFIEADYLQLNPDVAAAVTNGQFSSGYQHYQQYGYNENRQFNLLCTASSPTTPTPTPTVTPTPTPGGGCPFIEADYLQLNPDVAAAVANGQFSSGYQHYQQYGYNENRQFNLLCTASSPTTPTPPPATPTPTPYSGGAPLSLHPRNPHYLLFRGDPLLVVGSGEHYGALINKAFNYVTYFNELAAKGVNHTRLWMGSYSEIPGSFNIEANTLSPSAANLIQPWARSSTPGGADGNKFDLNTWNPEYFGRLRDLMNQAAARGIIVEISLFCVFYEDALWLKSPFYAGNNINGVGNFGRGTALTLSNGGLLAYQEAFVRKLVNELKDFDNFYFETVNEPYVTGVPDNFEARVTDWIVDAESPLPQKHLIARNPGETMPASMDSRVSIINLHYAEGAQVTPAGLAMNRLIGVNENGFDGTGDSTYRKQAWDFIVAGGGLYSNLDYSFVVGAEHGPTTLNSPGGGSPALRTQLGILRSFIQSFDFIEMSRNPGVVVSGNPGSVQALVEVGQQYAIFVSGASSASLGVSLPAGNYQALWINTKTGAVAKTENFSHGGGTRTLVSPSYSEDIALSIRAQ